MNPNPWGAPVIRAILLAARKQAVLVSGDGPLCSMSFLIKIRRTTKTHPGSHQFCSFPKTMFSPDSLAPWLCLKRSVCGLGGPRFNASATQISGGNEPHDVVP